MLGKGPTIPLSPFLNNATSLIESFLIIGYSPETIKSLHIDTSHILNTPPNIISFITNGKFSSHYDNICKYVFPSFPIIYNKNYAAHIKNRKTKFVFFFQKFNSNFMEHQRNNQSGCFAGFVYMFYETYTDYDKNQVIVPKAFCVVMRNCCFGFCNKICELIYEKYKRGIEVIPIEIVIHNIINFIPAPVNCNMIIDFEYLLSCKNESPRRSTISTSYSDNTSRRTLLETKYKYFIEQFVGYPQFHFCVYDILRIISYKHLVEIILYMLFEFNVLFFSENVELLNNVMYICVMLMYPLNDSHLLGQVMSISENEFNTKSFKNMKAHIMGINSSFKKCKHSSYFSKVDKFIIVNIDGKQIYTCAQIRHKIKLLKVDDDIKQIIEIITRLINKKKISSPYLENTIHKLLLSLSDFSKENLNEESNDLHNNDLFSYDLTEDNKNLNIEFQGIFYMGIVLFLKYFYQFYSTSINENFGDFSDATNDPVIVSETENIKISKEEKIIISLFSKTMIADRYFKYFLKKREIIDNYHIPFIFTDELIQSKSFIEQFLLNSNFNIFGKECFYLIDKIYLSNNGNKIYEIDFSEFCSFYQQLKDIFILHLAESPFYIKEDTKKGESNFISKHIEFDNDILFKYNYFLCNIDSLEKHFPSLNVLYINDITPISTVLIENEIESRLILFQEAKSKDIILCTYYYILACIAETIDLPCQYNAIISTLSLYGFSMRKAFNNLLTIYNKIIQHKYKEKQQMNEEIEYLDKLLQYVLSNGNLPNELFIRLMKQLLLLKKMLNYKPENKVTIIRKEKQYSDNKDVHFDLVSDDSSIKKREIKNHILKLLENGITDCDLSFQGKGNKVLDVRSIWLNMSISKINCKINTSIYSPIKLYKKVQSLTMEYISTGKRDIFTNDKFKQIISMQMFYMHYIEELKKVSYDPFIKYLKLYNK